MQDIHNKSTYSQRDHQRHWICRVRLKGADKLSDGNTTQKGRDQGALRADVKYTGATAESCVYSSQTCAFVRHFASIGAEERLFEPFRSCLF